jgi:hypothetical protein
MSNFKEKFLTGDIPYDAIDDFIDDWHNSTSQDTLPDFLGLTADEYHLLLLGEGKLKENLEQEKKQRNKSDKTRLVSALKKLI